MIIQKSLNFKFNNMPILFNIKTHTKWILLNAKLLVYFDQGDNMQV